MISECGFLNIVAAPDIAVHVHGVRQGCEMRLCTESACSEACALELLGCPGSAWAETSR